VAEHPDLQAEQEYLNRAYDGLEFMRGEARQMLQGVLDLGRGGTFQSRTERDIVVRTSLARLEQLDIGDQALYFGRIDRLPEPGDDSVLGESFHIGRLAVSGPDHEPLVVDWRAPVAEPFYRATGLDPQGLARRRHLAVRGRTVMGLEDEYFVDPDGQVAAPAPALDGAAASNGDGKRAGPDEGGERLLTDGLVLGGPGALLSALGQARTGRMGDIIGTIQREQDEIIRSPLAGVLVVQGGPGTGKTAVALHRAAYLLYTHRFPLERQGVLVVGPNPLFLRYIEQVLPSLGETGVSLSTVAGLVPEVRVRGADDPAVAKLKGDARMVRVLARAVRTRQRPLRHDAEVPFGATVLRLRAQATEDIVTAARRRPGTHNARRRFVETQVLRALADDYGARLSRSGVQPGDEETSQEEQEDLARRLRGVPEVADALDRMWPRLSPHELLHDLLGARPLLAAAGKGILKDDEVRRLYRPRGVSLDAVPWTVGDTALIDEARTILGPRRGRPTRAARAGRAEEGSAGDGFWPQGLAASPVPALATATAPDDDVRAFGHIVVDEAQDLTPMQFRMIARRAPSGSITVLGDLAQATGPWTYTDWGEVRALLASAAPSRHDELTLGYRAPGRVLDFASRLLPDAAPGVVPTSSIRLGRTDPVLRSVDESELADAALAEALALTAEHALVAVITPEEIHPRLTHLSRRDERVGRLDRDAMTRPVTIVPAPSVKGLEFDAVVVVEPSLIAGSDRRGLRLLYVALTRPIQHLSIVHASPLPAALVE